MKTKTLTTLLLATTLVGCPRDSSKDFAKAGEVEGYEVFVEYSDPSFRKIVIIDRENCTDDISCPYVYAEDSAAHGGFGRFDQIDLRFLPLEHPLQEYASLERLEEVYKKVSVSGEER